jgi:hypothetical protein
MAQPITITLGDLINHLRWGIGRVLNIEGTGHRAQAQIGFGELASRTTRHGGDHIRWVVTSRVHLIIVHNGWKE